MERIVSYLESRQFLVGCQSAPNFSLILTLDRRPKLNPPDFVPRTVAQVLGGLVQEFGQFFGARLLLGVGHYRLRARSA